MKGNNTNKFALSLLRVYHGCFVLGSEVTNELNLTNIEFPFPVCSYDDFKNQPCLHNTTLWVGCLLNLIDI